MSSDDIKKSVADAADHAQEATAHPKNTASDYASTASDKASDLAGKASDAASDAYGQARSKLNDVADSLPGSANEALKQGQKAYEAGSAQVIEQVKKQPIEALLLATAIGYLVGWATTR